MKTLPFDIGDEINVTIKGKIKEYSISENGDCWVVEIKDSTKMLLSMTKL